MGIRSRSVADFSAKYHTEAGLMGEGDRIQCTRKDLKALGIKLAVDDFGTGYSLLAYLKRYPVGKLKIDGRFIKDISGDAKDMESADTIIAMAPNLPGGAGRGGTQAQLAFVREQGCNPIGVTALA
ncbi:MAG: EAL domain-containing protein [Pseudomonadota bacterium]